MEISTLADVYDLATGNRARVGMFGTNSWHYGMMTRGTFHNGGDRGFAALLATEGDKLVGNPK